MLPDSPHQAREFIPRERLRETCVSDIGMWQHDEATSRLASTSDREKRCAVLQGKAPVRATLSWNKGNMLSGNNLLERDVAAHLGHI